MAFTLGSFTADSTLSHVTVLGLPSAGSTYVPAPELAEFVADSTLTPAVALGGFQIGAWIPLNFAWTPSGGITFGGAAGIVGDPWIPKGGITFGGGATVGGYSVLNFQQWPLGGITFSGSAPVSSSWSVFVPSGGIRFGGSARVDSDWRPSGGIAFGGSAVVQENIPFKPSGGIVFGGTAPVTLITPLTVTPTGGITFGGTAPVSSATVITPSGGITFGGAAPYSSNWTAYTPSGGITFGGSALAYLLPAGTTATTENPYATPFPGWAVNLETGAPSRYEGMAANSICHLNGVAYVANAGGIYALTGADDAGQQIRASITVPKTDSNDSHNKRVPQAYVGLRCSGQMELKAVTNDWQYQFYSVVPVDANVRGSRVVMGKGIEGRYWTYRLANVGGADFELDALEVPPTILRRHGV